MMEGFYSSGKVEPGPMRFVDHLVLLRGGGDLGTGVAWRLHRAGFPVIVCELATPLTVRRTVALSTAVTDGEIVIEAMKGRRMADTAEALSAAATGVVSVMVSPRLSDLAQSVVVDARVAKRNIDTTITDAALVVGLGPGFSAGIDCHAVVETMRGHRLGRVIWEGSAQPDTGVPGEVGGKSSSRVVRAPSDGLVRWQRRIGEVVQAGDMLGWVGDVPVHASNHGVIRGLIAEGMTVWSGLKIGDVDPRADPSLCWEISDKSLAVGGGVLEAVLTWLNR
jgi:xanthine dehydrogenase accessory factor